MIQFAVVCLIGAGIATTSAVYFNTPPAPHYQASVGNVQIDLAQLDFRLTFEDLQSIGLFPEATCRKCEFVRRGKTVNLDDFQDPLFMVSLLRYQRYLYLNFYSAHASTGRQRFDVVARQLRARFPGSGGAIRIDDGRGPEETTAR